MPVTGGAAHHYPSIATPIFQPLDFPAEVPPAATDSTSVIGLRAFARVRPGDWHVLVSDATPQAPDDLSDLTVAETLGSELADQLRPRHAGDLDRVLRYRGCARRLVEAVGTMPMAKINDDMLVLALKMLTDSVFSPTSKVYASSTARRTLSLLRHIATRWARAAGRTPAVSPGRAAPIRGAHTAGPMGRRRPRPVPTVEQVFHLLMVADEDLRAAIALAAGAGLRHGEVRGLHVDQVDPRARAVVLPARGSARPPSAYRMAWLPSWAWDLLAPLYSFRAEYSRSGGGWLFPGPLRGGCRSDFGRPLAAACGRAFGPGGPTFTMSALRRFWQAAARASGLPRAVVRQSWWTRDARQLPEGVLSARGTAYGWDELFGGPAELLGTAPWVPRRANGAVEAWAPERKALGQLAPLPASCRRPDE